MFDNVLIQEDLREKLSFAIQNKKMPHAIFLKGEQGSGNLPIAFSIAKEMLNKGKTEGLFGDQVVDERAERLSHPDLHIIFPIQQLASKKQVTCEGFVNEFREHYLKDDLTNFNDWLEHIGHADKDPIISVSEAENIMKKLSLRSYEGGFQVLIMWMPEMMNTECSNKLLKLIEEPEPKKLILMVGSDWDNLLPTIRSRMQLLNVKPFSRNSIKDWLINKLSLSHDVAEKIAMSSDGNPRQAAELANGNILGENDDFVNSWLKACNAYDHLSLMQLSDDFHGQNRTEKTTFLRAVLKRLNKALADDHVSLKHASKLQELVENSIYRLSRYAHSKTLFLDMSFKACKILNTS